MLLSVVVPVYKVEAYLDACVQSILAQTLKDLEVVLVDDGSPDGCPAMCDAWAEKDVRVRVVHKPNGGLSSARNAGLAVAQGDYVAFVDSDDTIEPEAYQVCVEKARQGGFDLVCFGYSIVRNSQKEPTRMPAFEVHSLPKLIPYFEEYASTASIFGSAWNKVYNTAFLRRHGLQFDEAILVNEDEPFNFDVLAHLGSMAFVDACYYNYFMHQNASITRKGSVEVYNIGIAREKHAVAFFEKTPSFEKLRAPYLAGRRKRALFNHYSQLTSRNGLTFIQRRNALKEITKDTQQRDMVCSVLATQRGVGAALGRMCLRAHCPGFLAFIVTIKNFAE